MTSKYMPRIYDSIIPEVIGICEEFNRERFSIQWLSDVIRETPEKYPHLSNLINTVPFHKFKEYTSKTLGHSDRFWTWNSQSSKCRVYIYRGMTE
jgi:hypothetical protein